jgi:hypothetical protein
VCLSPHEMTSAKIEGIIESYKRYADQYRAEGDLDSEKYCLTKVENFLLILKERAEDGTYHDDTDRY